MSHPSQKREKKSRQTIDKKTALSVLAVVLLPVLFVTVLLLVFKLFWAVPLLLLSLAIAFGLARRLRPDFFEALRRGKPEDMPVSTSSEPRISSPTRRAYMMLVGITNGLGQQITVNGSPFVIGRAPESDFCIADEYVSSRHLVIDYAAEENRCYATDVSSNGTYLNSVRMQNNVRRPLYQGDTLQIAGLLYRVEYVHF